MNPDGVFDVLPQARDDLASIARFLSASNPQKSTEFFRAARETFDELALSPFLGSPQFFSAPEHHSLRRWPVRLFRHYLVFYQPFASGNRVEIWRVLHHSQDVGPLLRDMTDSN